MAFRWGSVGVEKPRSESAALTSSPSAVKASRPRVAPSLIDAS
jgi:hypothetical protein